ncbi:MAG: response regulator [Deltaproteobacteria bacterium]|nr:response regulator [Deltaproteobacteria bacterium]
MSTAPLVVLLVEDNPGDARLIEIALCDPARADCVVERATTLAAGLERLAKGGIDAVLLDLGLPDSVGLETFARVRREFSDAPIVVITGNDDERAALEAMRHGAQDYLVKGSVDGVLLARSVRYAVERKRLEEALRKSEELLRTVLNNAPITIFAVDKQGLFTLSEGKSLDTVRLKPGENVGTSAMDLYESLPVILPDGKTICGQEVIRRVMAGETLAGITELRGIQFDNQFVPYRDAQGQIIGMIGVATIITERLHAESALRESERKYRELFDNAGEAILIADAETAIILDANKAAEALLGRAKHEIVGINRLDIHPAGRASDYREEFELHVRLGHVTDMESEIIRKDGTIIPVRISAKVIDLEGRKVIQGIFTDVTERRRAEEEKSTLAVQLQQAQKMEAVGQLAGGVAHDFNNILSVVLTYADFIMDEVPEGSPIRGDVDEIREAGERAAALTRQLLAFSRKQKAQPRLVDPNQIIRTLAKMLRRLIGEDIALDLDLDDNTGRALLDPTQLEQILVNLTVNARDAMPQGGRLAMSTRNVWLDGDAAAVRPGLSAGSHVEIAVCDTGTGIPAEVLPRIFDPFFSTKGKGTGLGLSIVHGAVAENHGHVGVSSEPGAGTTFKVLFPRTAGALPSVAPPEDGTWHMGRGETILVVEDDAAVRRATSRTLVESGYLVIEAEGGEQALARCRENPGGLRLVLTDVIMPGMSGPELARRLADVRPGLRVVYCSGYTDDMLARQGLPASGAVVVNKPIERSDLLRKLREVLDG